MVLADPWELARWSYVVLQLPLLGDRVKLSPKMGGRGHKESAILGAEMQGWTDGGRGRGVPAGEPGLQPPSWRKHFSLQHVLGKFTWRLSVQPFNLTVRRPEGWTAEQWGVDFPTKAKQGATENEHLLETWARRGLSSPHPPTGRNEEEQSGR